MDKPQIVFDIATARYHLRHAGETYDITEGMNQIIKKETALIRKAMFEALEEHCQDCERDWIRAFGTPFICEEDNCKTKAILRAERKGVKS